MDALCEMLADKLGITFDVAGDWLTIAVPQYAQMMALRYTMFDVGCGVILALLIPLCIFTWRGFDKPGIVNDHEDGFAIVFIVTCVLIPVTLALITAATVNAVLWNVTPDGMLLQELVGKVC